MGKKLGTDQFSGLAAAVVAQLPRDLDPKVAQAWIVGDGQRALRDVLDRALREGPPPPVDPDDYDDWVDELDLTTIERHEFEVTIDPTQTVEQMVATGQYRNVTPDYTTTLFGSHRAITGTKPIKQKVVAFRIGRNSATLDRAKRLRSRLNLGAIGIDHELAFGVQHKNALMDLGYIVNLDSVFVLDGKSRVSYLDVRGNLIAYWNLCMADACVNWSCLTWFFGLASESA